MLILFNIVVFFGSIFGMFWSVVNFKPTLLMDALLFISTAGTCVSLYWLWARFNLNDGITLHTPYLWRFYTFTPFDETPSEKKRNNPHYSDDSVDNILFGADKSLFSDDDAVENNNTTNVNNFAERPSLPKGSTFLVMCVILLLIAFEFDLFNNLPTIDLNKAVFVVFCGLGVSAVVFFVLYKVTNKNMDQQAPSPMLDTQLQSPDKNYELTHIKKSDNNTYVINYKQKTSSKKVQFKAVDSNNNNILEPNEIVDYRVIDKKP